MKLLFFFYLVLINSTVLCQTNLTFNAKQLTSMKLSDVSEQSYYIALNIDSAAIVAVTDDYILLHRNDNIYQFDVFGKLIRKFDYIKNLGGGFFFDSENKSHIISPSTFAGEVSVWNLNGTFQTKILLPKSSEGYLSRVIGFSQKTIWILQYITQKNDKVCLRISSMDIENDKLETVIERVFPVNEHCFYKVSFSSVVSKPYIGFHDNIVYTIDGKNVRPVIKYNTLNINRVLPHFAWIKICLQVGIYILKH